MAVVIKLVEDWRIRLSSISKFMQQLNQVISRQANIEEKCTGRFWEGRYKSQPLLTEEALLTAMAYVDLNPVRATIPNALPTVAGQALAKTPEASKHTSIKERIRPTFNIEKALINNPDFNSYYLQRFPIKPLSPFEGSIKQSNQDGMLFDFNDYLTLVDTTGRIQRQDKRGSIPNNFLPILERLGIESNEWIENTQKFEEIFYSKFYYQRNERNTA
ncbi:MAG: hypothetical protein ACI93R_003861 [Flavobacteriales bacterium]|jgi:hypothetical protein